MDHKYALHMSRYITSCHMFKLALAISLLTFFACGSSNHKRDAVPEGTATAESEFIVRWLKAVFNGRTNEAMATAELPFTFGNTTYKDMASLEHRTREVNLELTNSGV